MAITIADLILFNNVESTDLMQGAIQLPYYKPLTYIPNTTYVNGYQVYNEGNNGIGTQVLIRKLGRGNATHVKANTAGAFRYNHQNTADSLIVVPIDDIIKESEEVFEAVDIARISKTGARKAEIVMNNCVALSQNLISAGLVAAANTLTNVVPSTATTLVNDFLEAMAQLDYMPTVAVVSQNTYTNLLKLVTTRDFIPGIKFETIRTGLLGQFLGVDIYLDQDLPADVDFVLYNHNFFSVFTVLHFFDAVPATDFNGSYVRNLMGQGTYGPNQAKGEGAWGAVKKNAAE